MKRLLYILSFTVLGLLLATLVHAAIEIPLLAWMSGSLARGEVNLLWNNWPMLHRVGGAVLWVIGAGTGFMLGKYFWQILYVEKRYGTPRW